MLRRQLRAILEYGAILGWREGTMLEEKEGRW